MGKIVDVLDELVLRLRSETGDGGLLEDVKMVRFGTFGEARGDDSLPVIIVTHTGGEESADHRQNGQSFQIVKAQISIYMRKLSIANSETEPNSTFDTATAAGSPYLLERVLNTIEKNRSSRDWDLTLFNNSKSPADYSYTVNESNGIIVTRIDLNLTTENFVFGAR
jgi:hypothetical protein